MDRKIERYLDQIKEVQRLTAVTTAIYDERDPEHWTDEDKAWNEAFQRESLRLDNMRNSLAANDPTVLEWADAFLAGSAA